MPINDPKHLGGFNPEPGCKECQPKTPDQTESNPEAEQNKEKAKVKYIEHIKKTFDLSKLSDPEKQEFAELDWELSIIPIDVRDELQEIIFTLYSRKGGEAQYKSEFVDLHHGRALEIWRDPNSALKIFDSAHPGLREKIARWSELELTRNPKSALRIHPYNYRLEGL